VIPAVPETVATDGLQHTLEKLRSLKNVAHDDGSTQTPQPMASSSERCSMSATSPSSTQKYPRLVAFEKALAEGVPVYGVHDDRATRAWESYESAGKEIINGWP